MRQWKIDPEFRDLLPACDSDANEMLEADLVREGRPKDPIVIWKGHDIIVDGHRRYDICMRNSLPFTFIEKDFASREEVITWMEKHQVMRRNLSQVEYSLIIARMVGRRVNAGMGSNSAVAEVSEIRNRSERSVRRDVDVAKKLDSIDPILRPAATRLTHADIDRVLKMPREKAEKVASEVSEAESTDKAKEILETAVKPKAPKVEKKPIRGLVKNANDNGADLLKVCLTLSRHAGDPEGMKEVRFHMKKILDKIVEWTDGL